MRHCHTSSAQQHKVSTRAQYTKFWIEIKSLADTEAQTREDNYIARSKKLLLFFFFFKKHTLYVHVCTAVLTRLTKPVTQLCKCSLGRFCRCHFYSVSQQREMCHWNNFITQYSMVTEKKTFSPFLTNIQCVQEAIMVCIDPISIKQRSS